jgi:tetratricopeptide (TPR) repeat protein
MRYAVLCAKVEQWHEARLAANEAMAQSKLSETFTPIPNGVKPQLTQLQALSLLFDGIQAAKNGDDAADRKALERFNAALELSPTLAVASYQKGLILDNLGRHDEARNAYRGAALNGNNTLKRLVKEKAPDAHLQ